MKKQKSRDTHSARTDAGIPALLSKHARKLMQKRRRQINRRIPSADDEADESPSDLPGWEAEISHGIGSVWRRPIGLNEEATEHGQTWQD